MKRVMMYNMTACMVVELRVVLEVESSWFSGFWRIYEVFTTPSRTDVSHSTLPGAFLFLFMSYFAVVRPRHVVSHRDGLCAVAHLGWSTSENVFTCNGTGSCLFPAHGILGAYGGYICFIRRLPDSWSLLTL